LFLTLEISDLHLKVINTMYLVFVMSSLAKQRQRIGKHVHHTRFAGKRFANQHKPVKKKRKRVWRIS